MRGEDAAGEPGHGIAVVGQAYIPGIPGNQHPLGGGLQLADVLADGGLGQAEALGGLGETQGFGHGQERAELGGFEHGGLPDRCRIPLHCVL